MPLSQQIKSHQVGMVSKNRDMDMTWSARLSHVGWGVLSALSMILSCILCSLSLLLTVSLSQGSQGRAYLFNSVVNVGCGPAEERVLLTGLHAVADIFCDCCKTTLGPVNMIGLTFLILILFCAISGVHSITQKINHVDNLRMEI